MGEEQQLAFEEIKHRLVKLSVLHLSDSKKNSIYIQILVNALVAVLCIKFKIENLN